jgi:putative sigma-54 modulation protein
MQVSVTFRHMDATDALRHYAEDRMARIKKYFPDPIACHVVMSTERHTHRVDVNLQLHNGLQVAGSEATDNMYSAIDLVVAKIERQVKRYKDKLRDHKLRGDLASVPVAHSVIEEQHDDESPPGDAAAGHPPASAAEPVPIRPPRVVRREKFHAHPLSPAGAIMQMNLLHQEFLVFRNADTGQVNVVYRRSDGSFGLIETGPDDGGD